MKYKIFFLALVLVIIAAFFMLKPTTTKDEAWQVFRNYLEAAGKNDFDTLKNLSHQVSQVCLDSATSSECVSRMQTVYYFGSTLKKRDFTIVWEDKRQIILTTELKREESDQFVSLNRAIIYFVKDDAGNIKLLKFNDSKGASLSKENRSSQEIDDYLNKLMMDSDNDGLEDEIEQCVNMPAGCQKTDPAVRDTDGDGFWDGVEAQFIVP